MMSATRTLVLPLVLSMLGGLRASGQTSAPVQDRAEPLPPELAGVGIDEHLGAPLPLDVEFVDATGKAVKLRDYFDGQRPVILTLNYYRCPMLCGLMLNGLLDALRQLDWTAGQQFQVVTVSFDPLETHQLANIKRQNYLKAYERPTGNWHFLTGRQPSIDKLLEVTGFRIRYNEQRREWMHLAAPIICTPDGHVSRYLYGVLFEPKTLRLSLVEASEGKIGTTVDRILLYCYHYEGGQYTLAAMNIVRAGGGLTLVILATFLAVLWRRERRRPKVMQA
jgi:protein SCO1/2